MVEQVIIVTGASSGIGAQTTRALRSAGVNVIGVDRAPTSEADRHIVADLSTPDGVDVVLSQLDEGYDGLCNIAGVPGTAARDVVLNVNVHALRSLTAGTAPKLRDGAAIMNLASQAGGEWRSNIDLIRGFLSYSEWDAANDWLDERLPSELNTYAFSKQCVAALTQLQASELLPRGIRANAVSPGPVETPILADFRIDLGMATTQNAHDAVGRWGTPNDIARVVRALLDPDVTGWVNGAIIPVDGGLGASRFANAFEEARS